MIKLSIDLLFPQFFVDSKNTVVINKLKSRKTVRKNDLAKKFVETIDFLRLRIIITYEIEQVFPETLNPILEIA